MCGELTRPRNDLTFPIVRIRQQEDSLMGHWGGSSSTVITAKVSPIPVIDRIAVAESL
jgi:hypothetical protein